jgi:hypothetical protein
MDLDAYEEIISATFGISNDTSTTSESFIEAAKLFMWTIGDIPYDTSDTDKSSEWLENNLIAAANTQSGVSLTVGDIKYELYGAGINGIYTSFWVDISKAS